MPDITEITNLEITNLKDLWDEKQAEALQGNPLALLR
jgi:hypothetical protein